MQRLGSGLETGTISLLQSYPEPSLCMRVAENVIFEQATNSFHQIEHRASARYDSCCLPKFLRDLITWGATSLNESHVPLDGHQQLIVIKRGTICMVPVVKALGLYQS